MRAPGGRTPGGGGRGARDTSPNHPTSKMKDHCSDGRHNPFPHHPRRSVSPPVRSQPRRSPGRRSASVERREYPPRRSDHGKQSRSRPTPFEDEGYELPHKYILPAHPADPIPEVNPGLKPSRAIKDAGFHHQGRGAPASASSGLSWQGMLPQKSMFLDDGSGHNFYTMPPDTGYVSGAAPLKSESMGGGVGNMNVGIRDSEMLRYRDRPRDSYDERDREKIYPRETSFSLIPPSQVRTFGGTSSSGLAKDDLLDLYHDRLHHPSDGFGRAVGVNKLSDDPLERNGYSQVQLSDSMRRGPPVKDGPRDYIYYELGRSERVDQGFMVADDMYKKVPWSDRGDSRDTFGSSFMDLTGDMVDRADASHKILSESSIWNQNRSLREDSALDYRGMKMVREDYVGGSRSGHAGFRMKSSRDDELAPFEERYALMRDVAPMTYRERHRSPLLLDRHVDMYRHGVSPPRRTSRMDDLDMYDLSSERMVRRKYAMDDDVTQIESRGMFSNDRSAFRRIQSPSGSDEMWSNEDRVEFLPSKRLAFGHPNHRMSSNRTSGSDDWLPSGRGSAHAEGGSGMSLKRRLRPGPSEFHGSFPSERRHDFFRPYKFWKRGLERHGGLDAHRGDAYEDDPPLAKADPPEDSDEFKHQAHKAFFRFSKVLNESPHQQKRYREQGKAGNLLCCVCGSLSKEFVDTHSLVTHAYNSLKAGLRTEHLGLHKALCVLMGWNWLMAPDNGKLYQSRPVAEAKALKEDLILWPPLVIIHNSSIGNKKNTDGTKVVTVEGMEEILRDMGFGAGKTRVCRGKPANQCVFLVKFMPTFSGLQEAERLHKHYADNNRGRLEFQQITSGDDTAREAQVEEVLLYGYMAIAEDLDKLDPETKKRCLVKSKKDIEAIADAPLNTD